MEQPLNFFDLSATTLDGHQVSFSQWKGKKILVVNTASECGFTPQLEFLQELYSELESMGLMVIGFPSNDFGSQEPGSNSEIQEFCTRNYGVSFPLMSKSHVKNGPNQHPVYQWLTQKEKNGIADIKVTWNFQKFAVDENGRLVRSFSPETHPMDYAIVSWVHNPTLF